MNEKQRKQRSDKGQKRERYTQKARKQRKMFNDLQRSLNEVEKFEKREIELERSARLRKQRQQRYREQARAQGKKRVMTEGDKAAQKLRRRAKREELLHRLVPSRKCNLCLETCLHSRAWVYIENTKQMICRGCYQKLIDEIGKPLFTLFVNWLGDHGLTLSSDRGALETFTKDCWNGGILK